MSHDINPYEPPNAAIQGTVTSDANVVIDGSYLKVPRTGVTLAPRCVKCNQPGAKQLVRDLYWHSPWLYLMIPFPGIVFYALVAMIVRKKATVVVSLCERHANMRSAGIAIGWGGTLTGFIALFALPDPVGALVFVLALLFAPLTGLVMARVLDARRMDGTHAWLNVNKSFLDSYRR